MLIAIIILATLLAAAAVIIFYLYKVLKNTFSMTGGLIDLLDGKQPSSLKKAYNGIYYPATIIAKVNFDAEWEGTITDFSMYKTHGIVGMTVMTKESAADYYGAETIAALEEMGEEALAQLYSPTIMKNKIVYEVAEGVWSWKSAE